MYTFIYNMFPFVINVLLSKDKIKKDPRKCVDASD
jgi:hypothetical protein